MPQYDYQCAACGAVFEVEHSMTAKPKVKCAVCGSTRTAKQFSAAGVQFKGSGFYVTDSRDSDKKLTSGGKDITPKSDDASKSEGKSDSAGDTKASPDATAKTESTTKPETTKSSKPSKALEPAGK